MERLVGNYSDGTRNDDGDRSATHSLTRFCSLVGVEEIVDEEVLSVGAGELPQRSVVLLEEDSLLLISFAHERVLQTARDEWICFEFGL